jgi:tetratricopeptide (TPR) repeat protein
MRLIFLAGIVLTVSVIAYSVARAEKSETWQMKMNEISQFLGELAPYIYNEKAFNDSANRAKIEELTGKLSSLAHDIDPKKMARNGIQAPDFDPALNVLAAEFNDTVTRAHQIFKDGYTEYPRALLKTSVSYCISCHTRTPTAGIKPPTGFNDGIATASAAERIRFFAATRQFDKVTDEFEKAFTEKKDLRVVDLESAARVALSVALRVNKDIEAALKIANRVTSHPSAPESLKEDAKTWIKELELWKKETPVQPATTSAALAAARELVIRGQILQHSPTDARGDVAYLKASSLLHETLKKKPNPTDAADALYYIGVCYEALRDLGFWTLHESYFEACIRTKPASIRSEVCYTRLEDGLTLGYTGTRGTEIPPEVQRRLNTLKKMAKPVTRPPTTHP